MIKTTRGKNGLAQTLVRELVAICIPPALILRYYRANNPEP